MADTMKDGGPAFACAAENGHQEGMSLRDYFAAAALQGILTDPSVKPKDKLDDDLMAQEAYRLADAMLRARESKP